jgi:cytoskeletal protein CcmA (bactofilin family)
MGIFGRDERGAESKPTSPTPSKRQGSGAAAVSGASATVIARANRVEGTIVGSGDIQIEGELQGGVEGTGQLRVAERGIVEGTIRARNVTVGGSVRGDILANESIQLDATADVEGNITAPKIRIAEGATFQGQVLMKEVSEKPAPEGETSGPQTP